MTYDASNRKDIRRAEKLADELERQMADFIVAAMSTPQGRAWFYHRLAACQCFVDIPTFDSARDYFASGRRSVGLQDMATIQAHCPDHYLQMIKEENARIAVSRARDAAHDAAKSTSRDPADIDWNAADPYTLTDGAD